MPKSRANRVYFCISGRENKCEFFQFLQQNEKSKIFCEYEMDLHVIRNEVRVFALIYLLNHNIFAFVLAFLLT